MYNPIKAAQVIAFFALKNNSRSINILKAIKLVYLADRESLKQWGFPILDENRVSMPHGPVNSSTYSHINGEVDTNSCGWSQYLSDKANHEISVNKQVSLDDLDELSDADIECMEKVWTAFGEMDQWTIRDWTHDSNNVPEWEDPNGSSSIIPLERIMRHLGIENSELQLQKIEEFRNIDSLFAALSA
ncbi:Panacea domain-containing protein [Emcibacter sp.]|uniref:Panacea domain-containing protein n=1 Tax=Emcibacter sp. TaxID=1979954 RepID=UPI003A92B3D6